MSTGWLYVALDLLPSPSSSPRPASASTPKRNCCTDGLAGTDTPSQLIKAYVDIGIIGSMLPGLSNETCTLCNACVEACRENAIELDKENTLPVIDYSKCIMCAKCISACPTETIQKKEEGFRIMLGGRLGRHPRLAMEIPGLHSHTQVISIVKKCLKFYKANSKNGQRFSHILDSIDQIIV